MLTKSAAKLLDFGLANAGAGVVAGTSLSMLPTTPPNLTAEGTILGTFQLHGAGARRARTRTIEQPSMRVPTN